MIPPEHSLLWDKILNFQLDDAMAVRPFSAKLADEQQWSPAFAQAAIEEYRRFLFLCCILEKGAAPSAVVDEVWHLHLTYTRSYWVELCRETLGRDIHHYPSAGGGVEDEKHRNWYAETMRAYREVFGSEPPTDIWPAPGPAAAGAIQARPPLVWGPMNIAAAVILLLPFVYIGLTYGTINPFALGGPHFLVFFPLLSIAAVAVYVLSRLQLRQQMKAIVEANFPPDVSTFQVADLLYGKHRALQAAIVQLMQRGLLELYGKDQFLVKKENYRPDEGETNPLIPAFERVVNGRIVTYEELAGNWYDPWKFSHPSLAGLDQLARRSEPFLVAYGLQLLLVIVAVERIGQGFLNGRPVETLFKQAFFAGIVFLLATKWLERKAMIAGLVKKLFTRRISALRVESDRLAGQYALEGAPVIRGFAEGTSLVTLFGGFTAIGLLGSFSGKGGGPDSGSSGSSCSGGSSCGSSCGGCSGS